MSVPLRVLILEDRSADAALMLYELRRVGFEPHWQRVETETDYVARLHADLDMILAAYSLGQFDALQALALLRERDLDIPCIVVTGAVSEEAAVECMKQGAADYLLKDRLARLGMKGGSMVQSQQHSVLQLVPFVLEEQQYALPLLVVERVLPMVAVSPLPQAPPIALGVINLHGRVIPVLDIRRRLGFPIRDYGLTTYLLVARTSQRTCALPVDEVWGVREVAAEAVVSPDAILPYLGHVAGIVVLADGLLVVQDLEALLSLKEERRLAEVLEEMER